MIQRQSNITSFLTSPSPDTPSQENSTQPIKKKSKTSRKKTSWIWKYFVEKSNNNNELVIECQVKKENGIKCNVILKHDRSMGNGIGHLWSIYKITKDGKQPVFIYLNVFYVLIFKLINIIFLYNFFILFNFIKKIE